MSHVYPELKARQDFIVKLITQEETRFEETLSTGLEIIENLLSVKTGKTKQISGLDAFKLYDTYGFPIELTKEIVARSGFSVDMAGFEKEMNKQRERARAAMLRCSECGTRLKESDKKCPNCGSTKKTRGPIIFNVELKDGIGLSDTATIEVINNIQKTEFVGYTCLDQKAKILKILVDGKEVKEIKAGQVAGIVLDTTPFYGEMGGQVGDTGEILSKTGKFTVSNAVHVSPDVTLHNGKIVEGTLAIGAHICYRQPCARSSATISSSAARWSPRST
jgi:alanyl-tRNA synthetase